MHIPARAAIGQLFLTRSPIGHCLVELRKCKSASIRGGRIAPAPAVRFVSLLRNAGAFMEASLVA